MPRCPGDRRRAEPPACCGSVEARLIAERPRNGKRRQAARALSGTGTGSGSGDISRACGASVPHDTRVTPPNDFLLGKSYRDADFAFLHPALRALFRAMDSFETLARALAAADRLMGCHARRPRNCGCIVSPTGFVRQPFWCKLRRDRAGFGHQTLPGALPFATGIWSRFCLKMRSGKAILPASRHPQPDVAKGS